MLLDTWLAWLDLAGIAVFAASGALVASRKQMDVIGFMAMGAVTGVGGGTLRDVLLGRTPVFWLQKPELIGVACAVSLLVFFIAPHIENRYRTLLWADAVGLSLYAVLGAEIALLAGARPWAAVLLGVATATGGGIVRDVISNESPLILHREIYVTAAAAGATVFVVLRMTGTWREPALLIAAGACFLIRAAALRFGWSLPTYRPRPGRPPPAP
ncbi:trimeric intracellular cation channel family protein [Roseococcus sp. YIM B11640]|uniref:trimeric intracellular cation channel family protein n=1 Tax=Roseococcus sp. YIM B11640 TaxID=3133973 RepID=UPI003C7B2DAE